MIRFEMHSIANLMMLLARRKVLMKSMTDGSWFAGIVATSPCARDSFRETGRSSAHGRCQVTRRVELWAGYWLSIVAGGPASEL